MPGRLAAFTCAWMEMNRHRSRSGCGKVGSALLSTFPQPVLELLRFFTNLWDHQITFTENYLHNPCFLQNH